MIYQDEWNAPHFEISQPNVDMQLEISQTHVPGTIYAGDSAVQIKWDKLRNAWVSLIIGFDERIADYELAITGGMQSLDLDFASRNDYHLEFAVKEGAGINQNEDTLMRVKLQDQNFILSHSIGNQMVCGIQLSEEWVIYSIPLGNFVPDRSITNQFEFDWTRIKQINFDVPYFGEGSGKIWLDNIQLVKADLADNGANGCVNR